jgi:hypothetical protein
MAGQAFAFGCHFFNPDIRDYFKLLLMLLLSHNAAKLRQIMIFRNQILPAAGKGPGNQHPAKIAQNKCAIVLPLQPAGNRVLPPSKK